MVKYYVSNNFIGVICLSSRILKVILFAVLLVSIHSNVFAGGAMDDLMYNGVKKDDMSMVKMGIENGANVNYKPDTFSETALHVAIEHKNVNMVIYLCNNKALIDVGSLGNGINNRTELIHAATIGHLPLVQLFVEIGEKVNAVDKNGNTPLLSTLKTFWTPKGTVLEIVNFLISKNANVNQADNDGATPLMVIANCNGNDEMNIEIAKTLIAAGADPAKKDKYGKTALQRAINRSDVNMINLLMPISPK